MKCIFILADSFRRDHLGVYGNDWIHTPSFDALAGMSTVFDRMVAGSFPTGPNRRDILVGKGHQPGTPFNPWINIAPEETTFPQRLSAAGVHTMMITDVANGATWNRNMFKGFGHYYVNRGQEGDGCWSDANVDLTMPVPHELIRYPADLYHRVLTNRAHRRLEDDCFAPRTFRAACEWLERNWKRENFFLWVETFDPHEPWDAPAWYVDRYDPGYSGRVIDCPPYGYWRKLGMTERELRHTQALYAAECTMVDHAVGRLLATLEKLQLLEDVALVFTSDHGIYAGYPGDAGCIGKPWFVGEDGGWLIAGRQAAGTVTWLPLRPGTMKIPLIIKMPGQAKPRRSRRVTQPWDLHPTMLELFGQTPHDDLVGQSLLPLLEGRRPGPRPCAFNGYIWRGTRMVQTMTDDWLYATWPTGERDPLLIDLVNDPEGAVNAAAAHPQVCKRLHALAERRDPGGMKPA